MRRLVLVFVLFSLLSTCCALRYDLDACDIQEKYPDLFQVNLDIEVEPRDKPSTRSPPWEGFQTKGLNPKILFSSRDEQQESLSKFGRCLQFFILIMFNPSLSLFSLFILWIIISMTSDFFSVRLLSHVVKSHFFYTKRYLSFHKTKQLAHMT